MADYFPGLLLKKEVTYNTDSVPTAVANAMLTRNFSWKPLEIDLLERNLDLPARGAIAGVPTNERAMFEFECELAGAGAAGSTPPWMIPNEGCGLAAPVVSAGVKVEQRMAAINAALASMTAYGYLGALRHVGTGARGDLSGINFTAGQYPFLSYSYMALIPAAAPWTDAALAAPTLTAWKDPVEVSTGNTSISLDGFACVMRSAAFKSNTEMKLRNLVGSRYIQRGNHKMDGTIVIEAPTFAAKNYLTTLRAGTRVALNITHGVGAGNIVKIDAPTLQIRSISYSNEDDIVMASIDCVLTISAGQDDILLTSQ